MGKLIFLSRVITRMNLAHHCYQLEKKKKRDYQKNSSHVFSQYLSFIDLCSNEFRSSWVSSALWIKFWSVCTILASFLRNVDSRWDFGKYGWIRIVHQKRYMSEFQHHYIGQKFSLQALIWFWSCIVAEIIETPGSVDLCEAINFSNLS